MAPVPRCFLKGTRIRTSEGEIEVQDLAAGDMVITASGEATPVRWVGRRHLTIDPKADNRLAWPVRIKAGALADGVPSRDLRLSPSHALVIGGRLVDAVTLVNDRMIVQEPCAEADYFHVECDRHVALMAENTPAESYLESNDRSFFTNAAGATVLRPAMPCSSGKIAYPRLTDRHRLVELRRAIRLRGERMVASTGDQAVAEVA